MTATLPAGLHAAIDAAFAEQLAERSRQLDQREADLAAAAELLSLDSRITSSFAQGQATERQRILTLINLQLDYLSERSSTRLVLLNLKKLITEAA